MEPRRPECWSFRADCEWGRPELKKEGGPKKERWGALLAALHDAVYQPRRNHRQKI